jgi:hypothetical protein
MSYQKKTQVRKAGNDEATAQVLASLLASKFDNRDDVKVTITGSWVWIRGAGEDEADRAILKSAGACFHGKRTKEAGTSVWFVPGEPASFAPKKPTARIIEEGTTL